MIPMEERKFKDRPCDNCGKIFTPDAPGMKHCSPECQREGYKKKQKQLQAERKDRKEKHYSTIGEITQQYNIYRDKSAVSKYYFALRDMPDKDQRIILRMVDNIVFVSPRLSAISALEIVAQLGNWLNMVDARAI